MTTVYGVTRFGARLQIARQLKDIENFPKDAVWPASSYLTCKYLSESYRHIHEYGLDYMQHKRLKIGMQICKTNASNMHEKFQHIQHLIRKNSNLLAILFQNLPKYNQ